ncbi:MAG: hypothetical protein ACR2J8_08935, partial [Thermomicrobiales bacterium]
MRTIKPLLVAGTNLCGSRQVHAAPGEMRGLHPPASGNPGPDATARSKRPGPRPPLVIPGALAR